jgi:hypothetical protein
VLLRSSSSFPLMGLQAPLLPANRQTQHPFLSANLGCCEAQHTQHNAMQSAPAPPDLPLQPCPFASLAAALPLALPRLVVLPPARPCFHAFLPTLLPLLDGVDGLVLLVVHQHQASHLGQPLHQPLLDLVWTS